MLTVLWPPLIFHTTFKLFLREVQFFSSRSIKSRNQRSCEPLLFYSKCLLSFFKALKLKEKLSKVSAVKDIAARRHVSDCNRRCSPEGKTRREERISADSASQRQKERSGAREIRGNDWLTLYSDSQETLGEGFVRPRGIHAMAQLPRRISPVSPGYHSPR